MNNNQLLIIDGSSLLTTSFFATAPIDYQKAKTDEERIKASAKLMQKDGIFTNGVYRMMKTLLDIIRNQKPAYLCVAWDLSRDTFRREHYSLYKSNRSATKPELKSQFPLAQEVLAAMNVPQVLMPKVEADDLIGSLTTLMQGKVPITILTKDQDALQLVNEQVRLWYVTSKAEDMYKELGISLQDFNLPDGVFEFTPEYIEHFYGLKPIQIIDKKALEGDTSDFIPGVKGVGEASVVPLLREFGTVEGIYEFIEDNDEASIKEMLKALGIKRSPVANLTKTSDDPFELIGKRAAEMSKFLATIKMDIEVKLTVNPDAKFDELPVVRLDDLKLAINYTGQLDQFERLGFKSLLNEMPRTA